MEEKKKKTNWLLWGGLGAAVLAVFVSIPKKSKIKQYIENSQWLYLGDNTEGSQYFQDISNDGIITLNSKFSVDPFTAQLTDNETLTAISPNRPGKSYTFKKVG